MSVVTVMLIICFYCNLVDDIKIVPVELFSHSLSPFKNLLALEKLEIESGRFRFLSKVYLFLRMCAFFTNIYLRRGWCPESSSGL